MKERMIGWFGRSAKGGDRVCFGGDVDFVSPLRSNET